MLSPVRIIATIAIVALGSTTLLYTADQTPTLLPGGSSAESVLASDTALLDRSLEGWNTNDRALLEEVYAPDATHTALFHDRVNRHEGVDAIASVALLGGTMARIGELVPLPDTVLGERRYLSVMDFASGTPCVMWIEDDQITRHDCVVPKAFSGPSFTIGEPPADVSAEDLGALSLLAWNEMDRAAFEQAYRPEVVHRAAFTNIETEYEGLDELWPLMGRTTIERSIPNLMLPAPEGELRWAGYNNVGSGSLCDFWVKDGQIARQDCIVQ
jgi:hypothetical protein